MKPETDLTLDPITTLKPSPIHQGLVLIAPSASNTTPLRPKQLQLQHTSKPAMTRPTSLVTTHKRAGSTGTTGTGTGDEDEDERCCTTDEDEELCSIKDHVIGRLYDDDDKDADAGNGYDAYRDLATISDKLGDEVDGEVMAGRRRSSGGGATGRVEDMVTLMHRNSSDSSVYSDLGLDKCEDIDINNLNGEEATNGWKTDEQGIIGGKEHSLKQLQNDLRKAHEDLKLRDEEVGRLSRIRQDVETELEDLTASLFQEAHNMVREANEKQAHAEKTCRECQMKVDVLSAEVTALKTLVLTSTPSMPNPHLHPQIDLRGNHHYHHQQDGHSSPSSSSSVLFAKHRRTPSHFNLKYGRENSPPDSPVKECNPIVMTIGQLSLELNANEGLEVDPVVHEEFLQWKEKPCMDKEAPFIRRVYLEDVELCLRFNNEELSKKVFEAVENGTILIEAVGDKSKAMFPKKCALMEVPRQCYYRMNIGEPDNWHFISKICRNRIISVCDFFNYLKYIERGLVKSSVHDIYWEIARLRKDMVLARLGLSISS